MSNTAALSDSTAMMGMATSLVQGVNPETQVVRVRNVGDEDFTALYANVSYTIPAGQETIVPFLAMCLWLGHPDAVDIDAKRKYRLEEFQRLTARYGTYDNLDDWYECKPKLEAYSIDGNRLVTVVDDYEGNHLRVESSTAQEKATMHTAMAAMQEQMAAMQRKMEEMQRQESAVEASDLVSGVTEDKVAAPEGEAEPVVSGQVTVDKPRRVVVS